MHNFIKNEYPNGMKETMAIGYLKQLMLGFTEINRFQIMHRDMKPNNLFLKENNCLIIGDFGLAKVKSKHAVSRVGMTQTLTKY